MANTLLTTPILRRVTRNRVCVWLASSEQMELRLTVMNGQQAAIGQGDTADMRMHRVRLGENLHVYLLQARPDNNDGYPLDQLMYYRIDKKLENESFAELLTDEERKNLTYGSHSYPSFFIPSKLKTLLHGSCRKPHGGFNSGSQEHVPDALSHGHTLMEKTCDDLNLRPAILLLTGDQIYADDVSISLLSMLRKQALALTGKAEKLPLIGDVSAIPLHGRKKVLKDYESGFSSGESENHLLSFGEFAAMYLYAFGNLSKCEPIWEWAKLQKEGVEEEETENAYKACIKQGEPLRSYHQTLPVIRRLLANVPTYMIFDDHDVTDDWNITGYWYDSVRESPLGRRIVSNALAAYWAFQGWGNDPDNFDKDMIASIKAHLNDDSGSENIGKRYDLHTWKHRGWGFSIPTDPPIIATDSRTQRQYEGNKYYPAQLLDRYALDWLRVEWAKLKTGKNKIDDKTCPVLVATTPVMGFSTVEWFQRLGLGIMHWVEKFAPVAFLEGLIDKEGCLTGWMVDKLDAESWSSNRQGFLNFMDTLSLEDRMGINHCVFLSGDVHYSFTAKARFMREHSQLQCWQLTSSALSNEPGLKQSEFLKKAGKDKIGKETQCNCAIFPKNRWSMEVQLLRAGSSELRVTPECNLGLVQFADGLPVSHTLLTGNGNLVYRL